MRVEIFKIARPWRTGQLYSYSLYTSKSCKGFDYCGEYASLGTCKEAVRRLGVRLGQKIKVEVMK